MPRATGGVALLAVLIACALALGGAVASGTAYDLSYSVGAIGGVPSVIDIVSVATSGPSGGNLTGTFEVAGAINLTTPQDMYAVYFDGTSSDDAIAWITYTDDPTNGTLYNSTLIPPVNEPVSLSHDGSTLTFVVPVSDLGSAASFSVNVYAIHDGNGNSTNSWLGTSYASGRDQVCNDTTLQCMLIASGAGSGGSGGSGGASASSGSGIGGAELYALVGVAVVVVVAVVAVLVSRRGRASRPPPRPPPPGGAPPRN